MATGQAPLAEIEMHEDFTAIQVETVSIYNSFS